jgi:hypothetical protein
VRSFEFLLAQKLSRTVDELRHSISNAEYVEWGVYYARIAQRQELENLMAGW